MASLNDLSEKRRFLRILIKEYLDINKEEEINKELKKIENLFKKLYLAKTKNKRERVSKQLTEKINDLIKIDVPNFKQKSNAILKKTENYKNMDKFFGTSNPFKPQSIYQALNKLLDEYNNCFEDEIKKDDNNKSLTTKKEQKSQQTSQKRELRPQTRYKERRANQLSELRPQKTDEARRVNQSSAPRLRIQDEVIRANQPSEQEQAPYQSNESRLQTPDQSSEPRPQTLNQPSEQEQKPDQPREQEQKTYLPREQEQKTYQPREQEQKPDQPSESEQPTDVQTESIQTTNQPTKSSQPAYQEGKQEQSTYSPTEKLQKFIEESFGVIQIKQILLFTDEFIENLQELTQHMSSKDIENIEKKLEEYPINSLQETSQQKQIERLKEIISKNLAKIRIDKENKEKKKNGEQDTPKNEEPESNSLKIMKSSFEKFEALDGKVWYSIPWKEFEKIEQASEQENNEEPTLD